MGRIHELLVSSLNGLDITKKEAKPRDSLTVPHYDHFAKKKVCCYLYVVKLFKFPSKIGFRTLNTFFFHFYSSK